MRCRLCLQDKELLKNSHIIPEFMYWELFDEKHRMVRTQGLDISSAKRIQSGEKESNILCQQCDNEIIGKLEGYASRALFSGKGEDVKKIRTENQLHPDGILTSTFCKNVDYTKFKLFLLSMLWRASISKLDFFKEVELGPKEECLRRMIFQNMPLSQLDFPCFISSFIGHNRQMTSIIITSPRKIKNANGTRYIFQIGQFVLMYFVSKNDTPIWIQDAAITPENKMRIVHFDDKRSIEFMEAYFGSTIVQALQFVHGGTSPTQTNTKRTEFINSV